MKREILINACNLEVRVAAVEDNSLAEFYLERNQQRSLVGNIYKGKVTRVLPGMQAAFVDIGLEKAGFLHVSDFLTGIDAVGSAADMLGEEVETEPVAEEIAEPPAEDAPDLPVNQDGQLSQPEQEQGRGRRRRRRGAQPRRIRLPIEQQLHRGQEIIVQIAKEPMGTKGARLTSSISLPGRFLVYMPTSNNLGLSRRIESAEERARLRGILTELRPQQGGFIVRTACDGVSRREIQRDVAFLTKTWASILKKNEKSPPASMLYSDLDVALRTVRDLFSSEIDRLWCDDPDTYSRMVQFVQTYMPRLRGRVQLYHDNEPLFEHFKVEEQIERALDRKVWLKSS